MRTENILTDSQATMTLLLTFALIVGIIASTIFLLAYASHKRHSRRSQLRQVTRDYTS